jgi:hypothetical protein
LVRCYPALFGRSTVCVMKLCYFYLKYFTLRVCSFEIRSEFIYVYNVEYFVLLALSKIYGCIYCIVCTVDSSVLSAPVSQWIHAKTNGDAKSV